MMYDVADFLQCRLFGHMWFISNHRVIEVLYVYWKKTTVILLIAMWWPKILVNKYLFGTYAGAWALAKIYLSI